MAQDFGDESGEMLLRALKRNALFVSKKLFEHFKNQFTKQNTPTPEAPQTPNQIPSVQASGLLDLSSNKETTGTYKLANSSSKTQWIANEVALAQKQATNLEEFRSMLAQKSIGIAPSVKGENLFYEARRANDGSLLPYSHKQRDWAVSAETLKTKYGVDATNDWFNDKMPSTDGSMDSRGETADINQGIESHDGMDTNTSTLRVEREQTGTEVAPSVVRKNTEQAKPRYSLSSEAKSMRQASKQLSKEHGIEDKVTDISDKLNPMR